MAVVHREELLEIVSVREHGGDAEVALSPEVFMEVDPTEAQELLEAYLTLAKASLLEAHAGAPEGLVPRDEQAGALRLTMLTDSESNFLLGVAWGRETPPTLSLREGYARAAQVVELLLREVL